MEEWSGLDWRRRRGRERGEVIRCEARLGTWRTCFFFYTCKQAALDLHRAIARSASETFCFVFLSITHIAVVPDLAPPIAVGAVKKASKRKKIKQKCHRVQRVGRRHNHLNGIDLLL